MISTKFMSLSVENHTSKTICRALAPKLIVRYARSRMKRWQNHVSISFPFFSNPEDFRNWPRPHRNEKSSRMLYVAFLARPRTASSSGWARSWGIRCLRGFPCRLLSQSVEPCPTESPDLLCSLGTDCADREETCGPMTCLIGFIRPWTQPSQDCMGVYQCPVPRNPDSDLHYVRIVISLYKWATLSVPGLETPGASSLLYWYKTLWGLSL